MDGRDTWDVPKPGLPPKPYVYAWLDANLTYPYNILWHDYRIYPDIEKIWDLYLICDTSEPSKSSTNITISWDTNEVNKSEYEYVLLYEIGENKPYINMKSKNHFEIDVTLNTQYHFQIICSSQPFIISLCDGWNIISLPFNESLNKNNIIIRNNSVNYNWSGAVTEGVILDYLYNFNRTTQTYEFSDTFEPGFGYWIWSYYDCDIIIIQNITIEDDFITHLLDGWNIMGLPFDEIIPKTNITVTNNTIDYSWDEAVSQGILLDFVYSWNCTNQVYEFSDILIPGHGYWMYAYYNCTLKRN
jgi:hypothetical protein